MNVLVSLQVHVHVALSAALNTYVMGLRSLLIYYSFSAGITFSRQILTSKDDPRDESLSSIVPFISFILSVK